MSTNRIVRRITAALDDVGSVVACRGEVEDVITDDETGVVAYKHVGTKTRFTEAELNAVFPQSALLVRISELTALADGIAEAQDAADAAMTAAQDRIAELEQTVRELRGTPTFLASALLRELTQADNDKIVATISGSEGLREIWRRLFQRSDDEPIPVDSATCLAGITGLKAALGAERVSAIFAALNIDIDGAKYIKP